MDKRISLDEAVAMVPSGCTVGLGGMTLYRRPVAFVGALLAGKATDLTLLSLTCGFCCCNGIPFSVLGIVFSLVALAQIRNDPYSQEGRAVAIAGLILSLLSLVLAVVCFVLGFALNAPEIMRRMQRA